jgi:predicted MFS family arabinose efflux permease
MISFESLFPIRLADIVGSRDAAAALMGPVSAGAWAVSAVGAAMVPMFTRRFGRHVTAASMRVLQGLTVVTMAVLAGVVGAVTAYLACMLIHGASNPVHQAMLHEVAAADNRATVLSLNSLGASVAGAVGGIALGAVADGLSVPIAMAVGAAILAAAAPLYLIAHKPDRVHSLPA